MKCKLFPVMAVTTLMMAASCSQDELVENVISDNEVDVTFTADLKGMTETRAISDGLTVDELIFEVYDENGKRIDNLRQEGIKVDNHAATVNVRLVKGQDYQFVFWAQNSEQKYYNVEDLKEIEVTYASETNDEKRDAFYHYEGLTRVTGSFSKNVTLKRPFAQLNLGTTVMDIEAAKTAGVNITKSKIYVKGAIHQTLSTFDGEVETPATDVETGLSVNEIPSNTENLILKDKENQFDNDNYKYLATSYLLASEKGALSTEIQFELYDGENLINTLKVTNAPLQRNWRTNIVGDILTGEGTFNIVIDPIYENDYNYEMNGDTLDIWDGTTTMPTMNAQGEYVIDQASDLVGIASKEAGYWNEAKFILTKDLSFKNVDAPEGSTVDNNEDTTPATIAPLFKGGSNNTGEMNVTFNGNNRVIRDFIIEGENNFNALFGVANGITIKNLTVINANVKGNSKNADARASIILASGFGKIVMENIFIRDSKLEGGQKVGGLIGFVHDTANLTALNCIVDGLELSNYDLSSLDADGSGSTAGLIGCLNITSAMIDKCIVRNSNVNTIQGVEKPKRANGLFIGTIRSAAKDITLKNCVVENNNTFTNSIQWTPFYEPFIGGCEQGPSIKINNEEIYTKSINVDNTTLLAASDYVESAQMLEKMNIRLSEGAAIEMPTTVR